MPGIVGVVGDGKRELLDRMGSAIMTFELWHRMFIDEKVC